MSTEQLDRTADLSSLRIERDRPQPRRGFIWLIVAVLLGILLISLIYRVAFRGTEVSTTRAVLVTPSQASTILTASGYIVARNKAEISPKTVGRIAWINLEEGQKVRKGELVARLENQELEAQKAEKLASLANARRELARQKELFARGIVARQTLDNAQTQVEVLEAGLHFVEEQIRNTEIYAPIDGVVTVKKAFLGETVTPQGFGAGSSGATFAVIVDLDSLEMEADINEQNLEKLRLGMPAEVTLDAYPNRPYKARLRQIVPTADRQKGSVKVKVEILNKDQRVLPEMSCRVSFLNPESFRDTDNKPKVMIPTSSLVESDGKKGVFLVQEDTIKFRPITPGSTVDSQVEVKRGLSGGEELVTEAADLGLENGQKVRRKSE